MATVQQRPISHPSPRGDCPFDPPPAYQEAARSGPVSRISLWDGTPCWLVTGHAEIRAVLQDRRFSAHTEMPGFPFYSAAYRQFFNQDNLSPDPPA